MNQVPENSLRTIKKFPVKLFIGQIPKIWNEQELRKFFSNFGMVQDTQIIRDPTGNHKGCAFVTFSSITEADIAIEALNEATAKLQLKWADGEARKFGITNMNAEHANKILINNIPANNQQQFIKLLDRFGQIRIKKFIPYKNDPSKYTTKEQAIGAVKDLQNYNFQGNNLGCFFASQLLSQEFLTQNHQNKTQDFSQTLYMQQQQEQQTQSNVYYEFKDSSGQIYYFNPSQNKSQWEKPTEQDVQILPEEAYYNQDQKKTTNNYSTAQIFGKDNDNYVNVLAKGIPDQWSSDDFLAFCQTYNANTVYTEVLNAENIRSRKNRSYQIQRNL